MSGLDGKRMRPVPGLVEVSRVRACGAETGPAFRPSADLPSRKAVSCMRLVRCVRCGSVRPPFNGQLRTGTDKGNPTV